MARRGLLVLAAWVAVIGDLLVGAALLMARDARLQAVGVALILAAALALSGVTLAYYLANRRRARA